jgi:prephenate dehydrogenase
MTDGFPFRNVAVFGLGLLGGSLCKSIRRVDPGVKLSAFGRNPDRLKPALDDGAVDRIGRQDDADIGDADLVVVSMPVAVSIELIRDILNRDDLMPGALVIDVGSVKEDIVADAARQSRGASFIGCHPMAGSEKSGYAHGRDDLYSGSSVIITPHEMNRDEDVDAVRRFWEALGAKTVLTPPDMHDILVSRTSHLPHMAACVLVEQLDAAVGALGAGERAGFFIGNGFRDTTRIAAGSEEIWSEICSQNADNIIAAMDDYGKRLDELKEMIRNTAEDPDALNRYFLNMRKIREVVS